MGRLLFELVSLLEFLRAGNELVVPWLDWRGRDTRDVLNLIHVAEQRGACVLVLDLTRQPRRNGPHRPSRARQGSDGAAL